MKSSVTFLCAALLLSACNQSGTQQSAATPAAEPTATATTGTASQRTVSSSPDVDPAATSALERMSTYLRTLKAFQVKSATSRDDVLDNGQAIEVDGTVDMLVRVPDRMRAEVSSDRQHRMFFYDGKSFTLWARRVNYYATIPAPATLGELTTKLGDEYGLDVPLVDLFYWGSDRKRTSDIKGAIDVGPSQVEGVTCEHFAFRQDGADWQVWIQQGDYPLPRKLVITTTTDDARPTFTSVMNWNLAPSFNDAAFTFEAPPDAKKITFAQQSGTR